MPTLRSFHAARLPGRIAAAFFAFLLLGATLESAWAAGHCPHHDALPGQAAQPASHAGHHAPGESSDDAAEGPHGCPCVGACVSAAAMLPAPAGITAADTPLGGRPIVAAVARQAPASYLDLLPYANAPPVR